MDIKKKINKPFPSSNPKKKFDVYVKTREGNIKKISFGAKGYEDFTTHKDKERRRLFRLRHKCDPVSKLNKDSARYWACQFLWGK